jgi:ComF family protein
MAGTGAASVVQRTWAALLDLVYPPHCVACGRMGAWLCNACLGAYPAFRPPWCARCGVPLPRGGLCRACRGVTSPLAGMRSVGPHVAPMREAVHALKYGGVRVLADPLAEMMAATWCLSPLPVTAVVPVPLHPHRVRQRGYNQAVLLARALVPHLGVPSHEEWLVRARDTRSQVGLTRAERWANVDGAFRCTGPAAVAGQRVLLVDDVLTSGATLRAAAEALQAAGADAVWALTLTRARVGADAPLAEPKEDT